MDPRVLLRALRRVRRLSQRELAYEAGLPHSTIDRIESGATARPSFATIERIVDAVGYSVVISDWHYRLLALDEVHGRLRDRGSRQYPAHLELRQIRDMRDQWWGWHRIAFNDFDPRKPDWAYWKRSVYRLWDDPWEDAT